MDRAASRSRYRSGVHVLVLWSRSIRTRSHVPYYLFVPVLNLASTSKVHTLLAVPALNLAKFGYGCVTKNSTLKYLQGNKFR